MPRGFLKYLVIFTTVLLAIVLPFMLSGGIPDRRDDIVLLPRATVAIESMLTESAFASLFFTPSNSPEPPATTATPAPTGAIATDAPRLPTLLPSLTVVPATSTGQVIPITGNRERETNPKPTNKPPVATQKPPTNVPPTVELPTEETPTEETLTVEPPTEETATEEPPTEETPTVE
jgi:hypothetical protein